MSRHLLRAAVAGVIALFAGLVTTSPAQADIRTFPDVGEHIYSVRVSHGQSLLGVTARDNQMELGTYYHFWIDTNSANPGPEYKAEVYPNSDGLIFKRVGNFASSGIQVDCRGFRAVADVYGANYAKIFGPRSCIGVPAAVRVSVVGYYDENNDNHIDVVDWAPGEERFYPWVDR